MTHMMLTPRRCAGGGCRRYAKEDAAQVFITDALLTTLMVTPRSVYAWDIVVTRAAGRLFFDKRDGSTLDLLTVRKPLFSKSVTLCPAPHGA